MPADYGNNQSVTIYMDKEDVQKAETLAEGLKMTRSKFLALIIRDFFERCERLKEVKEMKDVLDMNEEEFKDWMVNGSVNLNFRLKEDQKYIFDLYR